MAGFNRVILAGNLTRDPELSYTATGVAVCKIGLAINRKWRDRDGNQKEDVCFVDCAVFGKLGEMVNQYMTKGRLILVEGRLNFQQWTDKEGKNRSKLGVIVENCTFLPSGNGQGQRGQSRSPDGQGDDQGQASDPGGDYPADPDVPF